jgi:hypothetical protein
MRYGIHYTVYPGGLEGYNDSNWISDVDEMKATHRYVLNNGRRTHNVRYNYCRSGITS